VPAELSSLEPLIVSLREQGYTVVGPTLRDGAIVLAELASADDLPHGYGVETGPGLYRIRRRGDQAAFGHSAGPQGWKRFLHPPRDPVLSASRLPDGSMQVDEPDAPATRYAFLGVRPCDLRAIAVQDRVLGTGSRYAQRRREALLIVVNCTDPSATCFCVSAGGGPGAGADSGADLVLTELADQGTDAGANGNGGAGGAGGVAGPAPRYLAEAGSEAGQRVLASLTPAEASDDLVARGQAAVSAAAGLMGRALPSVDLRGLLAQSLTSPRWDDVAGRCLACGNCTMACPTCFCTSIEDTTDLTGDHAQRWQQWASCYETDFSYLHGGSVRLSIHSRYRQWLTHKLGTWHDQFGESGCIGCGRCIAWCPVGIDITAEAQALAHDAEAPS
jgi:ferredoxin